MCPKKPCQGQITANGKHPCQNVFRENSLHHEYLQNQCQFEFGLRPNCVTVVVHIQQSFIHPTTMSIILRHLFLPSGFYILLVLYVKCPHFWVLTDITALQWLYSILFTLILLLKEIITSKLRIRFWVSVTLLCKISPDDFTRPTIFTLSLLFSH